MTPQLKPVVTGLTGQGVVTGLTPVVVGAGIISMGGGAVGESQQGRHGDGAHSGVRFHVGLGKTWATPFMD